MIKKNWCYLFAHECGLNQNCGKCLEYAQCCEEQRQDRKYSEQIHKEQGLFDDFFNADVLKIVNHYNGK